MPDGETLPLWLLIVRRDRPVLYQHLREHYEGDGRVDVIFDRRMVTTARPPEADRRRWDRRVGDRRRDETESERRRAQRRQPLAEPQQDFWVGEGFFMTRRVAHTSNP
jgi:hypothetical protein